jgi:uncharacterized protein (TIGR03435 family)
MLMLQSLLQDRFGLVMHKEQRDMRFFAMIPARSDGRPGPYLHRHADGPTCNIREFEAAEKARPKPSTGATVGFDCASITTLAELASRSAEMPVFDRTGLTGRWSVKLYFASRPSVAATPDPALPSLPTALQEQLGLKLEATRGPVDVMVIDSVHQPTEN